MARGIGIDIGEHQQARLLLHLVGVRGWSSDRCALRVLTSAISAQYQDVNGIGAASGCEEESKTQVGKEQKELGTHQQVAEELAYGTRHHRHTSIFLVFEKN